MPGVPVDGDCIELEHLRVEGRRARQGILQAGEGGVAMAERELGMAGLGQVEDAQLNAVQAEVEQLEEQQVEQMLEHQVEEHQLEQHEEQDQEQVENDNEGDDDDDQEVCRYTFLGSRICWVLVEFTAC